MLPILTVDSLDEAIDFVNQREKPLAMYVFTESKPTFERVNKLVSAGGVTHNDTLLHAGGEGVVWKGVVCILRWLCRSRGCSNIVCNHGLRMYFEFIPVLNIHVSA